MRPVVEGHMGKKFDKDGKESDTGIPGTTNKTWPGDLSKSGGAATWLGGTYDARIGLAGFGTVNPLWNSHLRRGDNLFSWSTAAIHLNRIASRPAKTDVPPYGAAHRDEMPAAARWYGRLTID